MTVHKDEIIMVGMNEYKPESMPGFYFAIFIQTYDYEQLPVFDPNHEYRTIREEHNFVDILFYDYDSAVKYILDLYPDAYRGSSPWRYEYMEENDVQITSITNIYINQCATDTAIKEHDPNEDYLKNDICPPDDTAAIF